MMKKLLVLMLVLGMAAGANAAIKLSLNGQDAPAEISIIPCTYIVIDVTSDTALTYGAYLGFDDSLGNIGGGPGEWKKEGGGTPWRTFEAAGGGRSIIADPDWTNWWDLTAFGNPMQLPLVTAGKHFEFDYHCTAYGPPDVIVKLLDFNLDEQDRMVIHQIPEPVSMVLLGLGGLLLRRRK